jgi:probable F420-dependent oxidoreductase
MPQAIGKTLIAQFNEGATVDILTDRSATWGEARPSVLGLRKLIVKFGVACMLTDESIGATVLATALEERSFGSLFVGDHSHIPVHRETPFPFGGDLPREFYRELDPFGSLSAAAVVTTSLVLGTGAVLPAQRDVFYTAKQVATLDHLCAGRFVFGVGAGWIVEQMRSHGIDPRTRGARLDEHLRALDAIWTQDSAEFHGTYVDFDPVFSWPKPTQPHVPIYVGGESVAAVRRASALGDMWMPNSGLDPAQVRRQFELRDRYAAGTPLTAYAVAPDNLAVIEEYVKQGAHQVVLHLPTLPADDSLAVLDAMAKTAEQYR